MKLSLSALLVAGALALAPSLEAQSFQRQWVPASANWVVHVNLEGLMKTTLVKELGLLDELKSESDYQEVVQKLGMSPVTDITSITIFGPRADPESACALIATNSAIETAMERLTQEVPNESVNVDGFALKRWQAEGETIFSYVAQNRSTDQRLMIISNDDADVTAALRVLRGEVPSMQSSGQLSVASPPGAGALIYIAAGEATTNFAKREADISSMAKMVKSAVIEAGEDGDEMYVKVTVDTNSADDASQVAQVAQGLVAMGGILAQNQPDAKPLVDMLQAMSLRADGSSLRLQLRQSTPRLMQLIHEHGDARFGKKHGHDQGAKQSLKQPPKSGDSKTGWR